MDKSRAAEAVELVCGCAARAVTALYNEELNPCGLRVTQFTLLEALERAGEITQAEPGDVLGIDTTTTF